MISGIEGVGGFDSAGMAARMLKKLDTNGDNAIDKTELQTLAHSGADMDVDSIIADLDGNNDGKIDTSELEDSLKNLGDEIAKRFAGSKMQGMQPPDPAEMFKKADTNGDGAISKTEFKNVGPGDASDDQVDEMFSSIDTDGNGSISEAENAAAMNAMGPPPPPPSNGSSIGASSTSSAASSTAAVSTTGIKQNSIAQLLDALKNSGSDEDDSSTTNASIKRLMSALQNSMVYSQQAELSASAGSAQSLFSISA